MPRPTGCRIVLVRARNPLNIGAAARAMANFGFRDLVLVDPYAEAWTEARSAVGAEDLLKAARVLTLEEALADRTLVIGTTAASRRPNLKDLVPLPDLPPLAAGHKVAILFGSEKHGLTHEHFSFCHLQARIPTVPDCPTMNLGQSVAVFCYEWTRQPQQRAPADAPRPARMEDIEGLREELMELLCASYYCPTPPRAGDHTRLRQLLLRVNPSARDIAILRGMVNKIAWKMGAKRSAP